MRRAFLGPALLLAGVLPAAAQAIPGFEAYFGYSNLRFGSTGTAPSFRANGGAAQLTYNFNEWLGFLGDIGAYHVGNLYDVFGAHNLVSFQFGPRFYWRKKKRISPYGQLLFGAMWSGPDRLPGSQLPFDGSETSFVMMAGGGLNIRVGRRISLRPVELDYLLTRMRDPVSNILGTQDNLRASAGVSLLFGGERPSARAQASRQATQVCPDGTTIPSGGACPQKQLPLTLRAPRTEICQGQTMSLAPSTVGSAGAMKYLWSVNGRPVSQGPQFEFVTMTLQPGSYRIGVTASGPGFRPASAEVTIRVSECHSSAINRQEGAARFRSDEIAHV